MIMQHLPILVVLLPLLAAPLVLLAPRGKWGWFIATLSSFGSFGLAFLLAYKVRRHGTMDYFLGGWVPPIGIQYRVDLLTAYILLLLALVAAILIVYALRSVPVEVGHSRERPFYAMFLLCLAGLMGMVMTHDLFNIYVFLEISSLATYTLIATARDRRALPAAFEYLILGTLGATFFLIGVGLLYMVTGTLNITDMAARIPQSGFERPVLAAFAFITLGLALKVAVFPLHVWLTNAYTHSPSFVAAFLAAIATKVSLYVMIRLVYSLFGWQFSFSMMPLEGVLLALGVAGIAVGSLVALHEQNLRRRLAFSSVAQVGYILVGLGLATHSGLTFALLQMFTHALAKAALFLAAGMLLYRAAIVEVGGMKGIARQMPFTTAGMVVAALSLIGVPGTAGFVAKWYFLVALVEQGQWALVALVVASTLAAAGYLWQILEPAYFAKRPAGAPALAEAPLSQHAALWGLVALNLFFGFHTSFSLDWARAIGRALLLPGVG